MIDTEKLRKKYSPNEASEHAADIVKRFREKCWREGIKPTAREFQKRLTGQMQQLGIPENAITEMCGILQVGWHMRDGDIPEF